MTLMKRWIPCDVRLPTRSGRYLVLTDNGDITISVFSESTKSWKQIEHSVISTIRSLVEPHYINVLEWREE